LRQAFSGHDYFFETFVVRNLHAPSISETARKMTIPTEWILMVLLALATVISTLAAIIYRQLSAEIANLRVLISRLQSDVDRLSKGCGLGACLYKNRL
jgi:hypothetical protein